MFRTSTPVTDEAFRNRARELERLDALVQRLVDGQPQWLAIIGPRKVGKTSLLLELTRRAHDPSVAFVVLDSFETTPISYEVFRRYALRLLDAVLATELGASLEAASARPAEYRALLLQSERFAQLPPDLQAAVMEVPEQRADARLMEVALRLPERVAEDCGLKVFVAWDEFQEVAGLASGRHGADPIPVMRSIWQRHERVAYVISGSKPSMLKELASGERSPFFQHFSLMELGPFGTDDAVRLLTDAAPLDRPVPKPLARRAVDVLGGHPFYLQLLGEGLMEHPPPYDESALKQALQELLFSRTGRLSLYLQNVFSGLVGRSTYLAQALKALAEGPRRLTDVAKAIGSPSGSTVRYLERLKDAVQRRDDGLYALADPVFGLWLRWRRPGGSVVPMTLIGDDAERATASHLAGMGFDLVYQSRASRGAFDLLATRGARQLALQVKRTALPVRFSRSAWKRMEAEADRFGWRWVVAVVTPEPDGRVRVLDPGRARIGREARLGGEAAIDNLLRWLDRG
jgi:AAA+ ATPase superfamily predicted ATPase